MRCRGKFPKSQCNDKAMPHIHQSHHNFPCNGNWLSAEIKWKFQFFISAFYDFHNGFMWCCSVVMGWMASAWGSQHSLAYHRFSHSPATSRSVVNDKTQQLCSYRFQTEMPFNCFDNARINKKREISYEWPACWGSCFSFLIWYETARRGEACKSPVQVLARAIRNANIFFRDGLNGVWARVRLQLSKALLMASLDTGRVNELFSSFIQFSRDDSKCKLSLKFHSFAPLVSVISSKLLNSTRLE